MMSIMLIGKSDRESKMTLEYFSDSETAPTQCVIHFLLWIMKKGFIGTHTHDFFQFVYITKKY